MGVLLVAEGVFIAADTFYFTDTWPIVFSTGLGVLLIMLGSGGTMTAGLWRHIVDVALPREQLWTRLIDPILAGASWPAVTSIEVLERDEDGLATRWLSRWRRGAYEGVLEVRVTSRVPNTFYGYRTSSGSHVEYSLAEIGAATRITRVEMVRTSLLFRLLKPLLAPQAKRNVERHLRSLAEDKRQGAEQPV